MNFDPITYVIQRMDTLQMRVRELEAHRDMHEGELKRIAQRIDLLELWRQSLTRIINKWPLIVVPIGMIGLNIAPQETVKTIGAIIKALI